MAFSKKLALPEIHRYFSDIKKMHHLDISEVSVNQEDTGLHKTLSQKVIGVTKGGVTKSTTVVSQKTYHKRLLVVLQKYQKGLLRHSW